MALEFPQREVVVLYRPPIANLVSNINVPVEVRETVKESGRKRERERECKGEDSLHDSVYPVLHCTNSSAVFMTPRMMQNLNMAIKQLPLK